MRKPVSGRSVYYRAIFPLICAALFPGILFSGCSGDKKREQDPVNLGEEIFISRCSACHSLDPHRKIGPSLYGLLGREVKLFSGKVFLRDKDYIKRSIADPDADIVSTFASGIMSGNLPPGSLSGKTQDALVEFLTSPKTGNASSPVKKSEK